MDFNSVKEVTKTIKIALPCRYITNEEAGIRDILESWKQQYVKELQGVVVSYKNVELSSNTGLSIVDKPFVFYDVTATYEVFCPSVGSIVKGKINRISHDLVGCLVHDTINVAIKLQENGLEELKNYLVLDRMVLLKITSFSFHRRVIKVRGEITEDCVRLMRADPLFRVQNTAQKNSRITYSSGESDAELRADSASDDARDGSSIYNEQSQGSLTSQNTGDRNKHHVYNVDHLADGHGFSSSNDSDSVLQHLKLNNWSTEDADRSLRESGGGEKTGTVQSPKKSPKKKNPKKRKRGEEDSTAASASDDIEAMLIKAETNSWNEMAETPPKKKRKKSKDSVEAGVESPSAKKAKRRKSQSKEKDANLTNETDSTFIDMDEMLSQIKAEEKYADESGESPPKKKRKKNTDGVSGVKSAGSKKKSQNKENIKAGKSAQDDSAFIDDSTMLSLVKAESSYLYENEEELVNNIIIGEQAKVTSPEKSKEKKKSNAKEKSKVKKSSHKGSSSNDIDSMIEHIKKKRNIVDENKGKPKVKRKKRDKTDGKLSNSKKSKKKKSEKKEEHLTKDKRKKKKLGKDSKKDKKKKKLKASS